MQRFTEHKISSFRKIINQGEVSNCDLSSANTSTLDAYNNDHFIVNALTDFYDRLSNLKGNCDFISGGGQTEKMDTTGGAGDLLPFSGGNDVVTFPAFTTTTAAATPNTAVVSIETDAFQGSVRVHTAASRHHR